MPVAVMMIGMDAPTALADTNPVRTSPRAMEPTTKGGTPTIAGLPSGPSASTEASADGVGTGRWCVGGGMVVKVVTDVGHDVPPTVGTAPGGGGRANGAGWSRTSQPPWYSCTWWSQPDPAPSLSSWRPSIVRTCPNS